MRARTCIAIFPEILAGSRKEEERGEREERGEKERIRQKDSVRSYITPLCRAVPELNVRAHS